jgi:hypothetical protein
MWLAALLMANSTEAAPAGAHAAQREAAGDVA